MPEELLIEMLADIKSGFTFRDGIKDQEEGTIRVLQIKDVRGHASIRPDGLPRMIWEGKGEPPILQAGDVVLTSRGDHHTAAIYEGGPPVVPTSQLFVLRVKNDKVFPKYLCWFINHADVARRHIETNLTGSSMPALAKAAVAGMPVYVPPLDTQHRIVEMQHLADEEAQCLDQLKANRKNMLKAIFKELMEQKS